MTQKQNRTRILLSLALLLAGLFVALSKWFLGVDLTYWEFLASLNTVAWLSRVLTTLADLAIVLGVVFLVKSYLMSAAMRRMLAGQGVLARWEYPGDSGMQGTAVISANGVLFSGKLHLWKTMWTEPAHAEIRSEPGKTQILVWVSSTVMFMRNQYGIAVPVPPGHESEAEAVLKAITDHAGRQGRVKAER